MTEQSPIKNGWSYRHKIGVVHVENWGKPFLVVTENKFWNGDSWGYHYYPLGKKYEKVEDGFAESEQLNNEFGLPRYFNSDDSQSFLLGLQERFVNAEIAATKN